MSGPFDTRSSVFPARACTTSSSIQGYSCGLTPTKLLNFSLQSPAAPRLLTLCSSKDAQGLKLDASGHIFSNSQGSSYQVSIQHFPTLLGSLTAMPRPQRPAFEEAVTASPLFKLALEIRIMIYELLLIQEGGMSIPSDIFARRDYSRTGSEPYQCIFCGLDFLSEDGCVQHVAKRHSREHIGCERPLRPLLPGISTSLLQTCRIIRSEASPILYSRNSFHFSHATTASNFRWGIDCVHAGSIQEIGIRFGSPYYKHITPWLTYITKCTHSLGQDFPHLKRMILNLDMWIGVESATVLCSISEGLGKKSQGLDWVLVLMLNNEEVLDCFEPLVVREDDSKNGKREVRRHVWRNAVGHHWKNALLWWGFPNESVPQKYRVIGDQTQQQISSE